MEGPVELDATRDPSAVGTDESRLDYVLTVKKIISRGLIKCLEDATAHCRKNGKADILVFKTDDGPFFLGAMFTVGGGDHANGIGVARGALVICRFGKHGHFLCFRDWIGGDFPLLNRCVYGHNLFFHGENPRFFFVF